MKQQNKTRPDLPQLLIQNKIKTRTDFPVFKENIILPKVEKLYDTSYKIVNIKS